MRLIDADELVRNISSQTILGDTVAKIMDKYLYCINNQPTAYDIDKVVEELEEFKLHYEKIALSINDEIERRIYIAKEAAMYNAIEIVRRGGKE